MKICSSIYNEFECAADCCPFTCCQQWRISVDEETEKRWGELPEPAKPSQLCAAEVIGAEGDRLIRLGADGFCPLLNPGGLCSVQLFCGPEAIPRTCRVFPREIHEFEDRQEAYLALCCPAVIDLLKERGFHWADPDAAASVAAKEILAALREKYLTVVKNTPDAFLAMKKIFSLALDSLMETAGIPADSDDNERIPASAGDGERIYVSADECFQECNELFLDLTVNYRAQGLYREYIEAAAELSDRISAGEYQAEQLTAMRAAFSDAFVFYRPLMRELLRSEIASETLLPGYEREDMVIKLEWIAMELAAVRHLCFLRYTLDGKLEYPVFRDCCAVVFRMMGYDDEDIMEYLEESFETVIWPEGYLVLLMGRF